MAAIILNPVGIFGVVYRGAKVCKNSEYVILDLEFENDKKLSGLVTEKCLMTVEKVKELGLNQMQVGGSYSIRTSVSIQKANGKYAAKVQYNPIELLGETTTPDYAPIGEPVEV